MGLLFLLNGNFQNFCMLLYDYLMIGSHETPSIRSSGYIVMQQKKTFKNSPLKVRRRWSRNPMTRIKESVKVYSRQKSKKQLREGVFEEKEFVYRVWKTMKKQEKENPSMALLHERLEGSIQLMVLTGGIASGKSTVAEMIRK